MRKSSRRLVLLLLFWTISGFVFGGHLNGDDIGALIKQLQSSGSIERARAASALAAMGNKAKEAIPNLEKLLDDRAQLLWTSEGFLTQPTSGQLTTPGREAALAIWRIEGGIARLLAALKVEDWRVRENVAKAFAEIKDPNAIEPLLNEIRKKDSLVSSAASAALGLIGGPAVAPLLQALQDKDEHVRLYAADALGIAKDKRAIEPLIFRLTDEDVNVRRVSAEALGKIPDPRGTAALIRILDDDDSYVRELAAGSLGKIKDKEAVIPLIKRLKDFDHAVRRAAAEALGDIRDPRAIEPLTAALKDQDPQVISQAQSALNKIKNKY